MHTWIARCRCDWLDDFQTEEFTFELPTWHLVEAATLIENKLILGSSAYTLISLERVI